MKLSYGKHITYLNHSKLRWYNNVDFTISFSYNITFYNLYRNYYLSLQNKLVDFE